MVPLSQIYYWGNIKISLFSPPPPPAGWRPPPPPPPSARGPINVVGKKEKRVLVFSCFPLKNIGAVWFKRFLSLTDGLINKQCFVLVSCLCRLPGVYRLLTTMKPCKKCTCTSIPIHNKYWHHIKIVTLLTIDWPFSMIPIYFSVPIGFFILEPIHTEHKYREARRVLYRALYVRYVWMERPSNLALYFGLPRNLPVCSFYLLPVRSSMHSN